MRRAVVATRVTKSVIFSRKFQLIELLAVFSERGWLHSPVIFSARWRQTSFRKRLHHITIALLSDPQRGGAYAVLIGGWSLGAYLTQWVLGNLKDLLLNHNQWVIGYLVVVGE